MVANLLFFGIGGVALLLMGLWGLRKAGQLSAVDGWDEDSRAHRRGVVRRGGFTCVGLGGVFLVLAVLSMLLPAGP